MTKDYTKFSNEKTKVTVEETVVTIESPEVEITDEVEVETVPETKYGRVANCLRLNVRKKPNPYSEVVTVLERGDEVAITDEESTIEFYKVCTASGVEGFCMRNFIEVK